MLDVVLILVFLLLFVYSCVVSYYCYKFAMILIKLEDVIEESLFKLESIRLQFLEILEIPVFFDSIEIRKCIQLIKTAKIVVEETMNKLAESPGFNVKLDNSDSETIKKNLGEKIESERKEED